MSELAIVILAAGRGTRMKSARAKVLHEIGGLPMLGHVLAAAGALAPARSIVVVGADGDSVRRAALNLSPGVMVATQDPPRGTGDAVRQALPALEGFEGVVLVLYADTPLVSTATMAALAAEISAGAAVAALGFRPAAPGAYGRLILSPDGRLEAIVEAGDASPEELAVDLCNSGVMAFDAAFMRRALPTLRNDNAKGEYYLTDLVAIARREGLGAGVAEADPEEVMGVNSRAELAAAEAVFQGRRRRAAMAAGATLIDPSTVYFSFDTELADDVHVEPNVFFGPGVSVARGAIVKAFSHLEGASVGERASVGPFARLRPGANLAAAAKVGNFVEIKKAEIGPDAKVSHLTYIGDASVGARANIGAGTITCNYDGFSKHVTTIGEDAFVGSNSALVAPVEIGAGAYVGSGSVITTNVPPGALAVARGRQSVIAGWAARFRTRKDAGRQ